MSLKLAKYGFMENTGCFFVVFNQTWFLCGWVYMFDQLAAPLVSTFEEMRSKFLC